MILGGMAGRRNDEIAAELGVRPHTVGVGRQRFAQEGLAGLRDRSRAGRPSTYPADLKQQILKQLEAPPPAGQATWDGGPLARALGVSEDSFGGLCARKGSPCDGAAPGA